MSIGCSSYTPTKWERLDYLVRAHVGIVKLVIDKESWVEPAYHYFDFYAGPGLYKNTERSDLAGQYGSPIRVLRIIEPILAYRAFVFDPRYGDRLRKSVASAGFDHARVLVGHVDCERAVNALIEHGIGPETHKAIFGLAFFDPNGPPNWDAIERFSSCPTFSRIDLLININSSISKLCFSSPLHPEQFRPTEHLRRLGKRSIYLWNPPISDPHQFTLAYCTNGPITEFKQLGFWEISSIKGQGIQRRIDYPTRERRRLDQPGLLPGIEWM